MRSFDILGMSFRNLFKRKLRTFLTILGVIIGVVAIVLMVSLGVGVNMNFDKQMENMGDLTIIQLYNWEGYWGNNGAPAFDDAAIKKIADLKGVKVVSPVAYGNLKLLSGRYSANVQVMGIRPEAMEALGYTTSQGGFLSSDSKDYEIVFGVNPPYSFMSEIERKRQQASQGGKGYGRMVMFGPGMTMEGEVERDPPKIDVINDKITGSYFWEYGNKDVQYPNGKKPDVYTFKGVGILEKNETKWETSEYCFIDIEKLIKITKDQQKYEKIAYGNRGNSQKTYGYEQGYIKCNEINDVENVMEELEKMGFTNYYNPLSWINEMKKMSESLQTLLAAIGGVSLFVAAIGIANTMVMSMYERTREIGIMKVIGAAIKDIRKLFLLEAALIGVIGGTIGMGLSYLASFILNNVGIPFLSAMTYNPTGEPTTISYIPLWLSLSALVFSATIGLLAGYFPARRAMRLSALTAIKAE